MQLTITVDLGRTATLDSRMSAAIDRALRGGTEDATTLLLREMKVYPPPPARVQGTAVAPVRFTTSGGQSVNFMARRAKPYKRTNTLKGSWHRTVKRAANGWQGEVKSSGNTAPYNIYVQKEGMQAAVHRGRWPSEQAVATRLQPQIVRMYEVRVAQAVSRV